MIGQNVARASRSGLRAATLLGRRTMVTQEERWTLETARNAGAFIEGPNKVQLSHIVPNIEASWKTLSKEEQYGVFRQLEELQRKDWKELSLDEKKAEWPLGLPVNQPNRVPLLCFIWSSRPPQAHHCLWPGCQDPRRCCRCSRYHLWYLLPHARQCENYKGKGHVQSA
ncbi:hypothetical protein [Sporisorium scitamineum]|uniref:Uncharacterized protein n=1 Tax=Sporisorium scitamineum TaxID=49012 RepID=A0A0F7SE33_9BASI|nr:hypothetical protein [Sporisorium scitamineum]